MEKEAPGAKTEEIEKEVEDGKVLYELEVVVDGKELEMEIADDGRLVEIEEDDNDD